MIGVGRPPASATRRCHASWSSIVDAHATWCTVPAPGTPGSSGAVSYSIQPPRESPRVSQRSPAALEAELPRGTARCAALDVARVRAHALESLQRELARNLRMVGDQRLVGHVRDDELVPKPLRIAEATRVAVALDAEPLGPEVERLRRADAPDDRVHHAGAGAAGCGARVLEEGDVRARRPLLVRVEEVVDGRIVLVDGLLHEPQPEHAGVEVDVRRGVARDAGHVVDAVELIVRSS